MTDTFSLEARYYDKLWGSEQMQYAETQFLDKVLKKHGALRVLDLACGTGGHSLRLARLGYDVVGLDVSQTMLKKAREKLSEADFQVSLVLADMKETYSSLQKAKIPLFFDAVICMGYSLAHLLDDESLGATLDEIQKVLRPGGIFIFCVRNAEKLRDDLMRKLRMDSIVNEPDLQLALLCYNFRDKSNSDILVWNTLWLINDRGRVDFQVRTHPLRWFRYDSLEEILRTHNFDAICAYGDTMGNEPFDGDKHDTIFMICRRGEVT